MPRNVNRVVLAYDKDGVAHFFGPGDDVPAWAAKAITNDDVWVDPPGRQPQTGSTPIQDGGNR